MSQAQPHHLALDAQALREAVEAHQRYLAGRSGGRRLSLTYADLSNCTLEGLDLREADFAGANFHGATLARANLSRGILFGADLRQADLRRANLGGADLTGADLAGADLSGASMKRTVLTGANLESATLDNVDMSDVLRAPPPVVYVDSRPIDQVLAEYEVYCDSGGEGGAVADFSNVDFRTMRTLKARRLPPLVPPTTTSFGLPLHRAHLH